MMIKQQPGPAQKKILFLKGKKILVVDDFSSFRNTVKSMLRSFGVVNVEEAPDGEEAVAKLSGKRYDIVLCDYNLGAGKDGQQVLEEARYRGYIDNSTIFMMLTAESTMDMFMGALEYEPDDYLIKPFTREILERKLRDWISKKEEMKDIQRFLANNDYRGALARCDGFIEGNPKNLSQFLKLKGEILIKQEAYAEAEAFYREVLEMGDLPWAGLNLGKIHFLRGNYEEAKAVFEGIISRNDKIVAAYDWLAKIHEKTGDLQSAQKVLQDAVDISPKALLRQKALGDVAFRNRDIDVAERSLKEAVKQGKHSVYKSPAEYISLANVLGEKNDPAGSLAVLSEGGKEFAGNPEASLKLCVTEVITLKKLDRGDDAKKAMEKVKKLSSSVPANKIVLDTELELAKSLIQMGDEKSGNEIIRRIVQSNHEDEALLSSVQTVFKELNIEKEGEQIIATARDEVIVLNNEGAGLVREGKLDKAIELFEKAIEQLPDNKIINANAAYAFILHMKKNAVNGNFLEKARKCLERVEEIDPAYKDLKILLIMYRELAQGAAKRG